MGDMVKCRLLNIVLLLLSIVSSTWAKDKWEGAWITCYDNQNAVNTWTAYRKTFQIDEISTEAVAAIAVDSKYWLWINGKLVVREGGLKRGPSRFDTYYDEIDIAPYLKHGKNQIAVLTCYYGKDGFSHISSGKSGLLFECITPQFKIISDRSWKAALLNCFKCCEDPQPNFRLSESSILYDATKAIEGWQKQGYDDSWMPQARIFGEAGCAPWNKLIKRPIPQWKDFQLKKYSDISKKGDTIVCSLPYNCQFTTYLKINSSSNKHVKIYTDNYLFYDGAGTGLKSEYITKAGVQEYETYLWVNGHKVYYVIPEGVEIIDLQYRESGYNCDFSGSFHCSDSFFNNLWEKARRSLYVTMRDNYMDCPDRERAQWAGDAVNESLEAYYCLSPSSQLLTRKWLLETIGWQRENGNMYAPIPSGNWFDELPGQILATIGYMGSWYYYLYSGDESILPIVYPHIKKYLTLWEQDSEGIVGLRQGDWNWGDWGDNRDMTLIYNLWYYLAVKSMYKMALVLDNGEAMYYREYMRKFKQAFNERFWTGAAYRHPFYTDRTDDRVQALAVIAEIADSTKYPALLNIFQKEEHASPYMEKYVFEAMMKMGYEKEALSRHKKRFLSMVNNTQFSTLFEGWGIGDEGYGGGTVNHGWSGGGLSVLSQYVCGVAPLLPGFKEFSILPQPGDLKYASIKVPSVAGDIYTEFNNEKAEFMLKVEIPLKARALVGVPDQYSKIYINGKLVWEKGKLVYSHYTSSFIETQKHIAFWLTEGNYQLKAIQQ